MSSDRAFGLIGGDRIRRTAIPRPDPDVVRRFLDLPDMAGLVARAMDRIGLTSTIPAHELAPLTPGKRVVGPAITIRNVPSRHAPLYGWQQEIDTQLGEREAYYLAEPGDVLVVDSGGRMLASSLGPNSAALALSRGLAGAIVDGVVTGPAGIRGHDFPVWCRGGTTLTGHYRNDTAEINGVVACGPAQVAPGDLVVADDSGVSIVAAAHITLILETSLRLAEKGRALADAVSAKAPPGTIREALKSLMKDDGSPRLKL